nr:MAG TPA: hypothetical protein [Siphoviridae sp. cttiG1]
MYDESFFRMIHSGNRALIRFINPDWYVLSFMESS